MKLTKQQVSASDTKMPLLSFTEEGRLSRFGGLPILGHLFSLLSLRSRLEKAVGGGSSNDDVYSRGGILLLLMTMLMLGFRRLSDVRWLQGDVLIGRLLGWKRLPSTATFSRVLSSMSAEAVDRLRELSTAIVVDALQQASPSSVTVDFDGVVQSTKGHAEGTAVGFNKQKKGARSYWPLFATIEGFGFSYILDVLHRPGNVHDSNGAGPFMQETLSAVKTALPDVSVDSRMDAAFFDHELLEGISQLGVVFTCSVPFNRLAALKKVVQDCSDWQNAVGAPGSEHTRWTYAETPYQPKKWSKIGRNFRFVLVRQRKPKQKKGPVQLDLFEPNDTEFDYSVIVTNDRHNSAASIVEHHHGRGRQEKLFGDAKQDVALGHIATRTLVGNQTFTCISMIAHNLGRILERHVPSLQSGSIRRLRTLRRRLFELPARLTFPQRRPLLTIHASPSVEAEISSTINSILQLQQAA